jgi:hypothetical protein
MYGCPSVKNLDVIFSATITLARKPFAIWSEVGWLQVVTTTTTSGLLPSAYS